MIWFWLLDWFPHKIEWVSLNESESNNSFLLFCVFLKFVTPGSNYLQQQQQQNIKNNASNKNNMFWKRFKVENMYKV